jgi:hypothetical protein
MDSNWASENLQVIRTLMERSAIYRRALAPMMILCGLVGTAAALVGLLAQIDRPAAFIAYWMAVSVAPLAGCFLVARAQAMKDAEPFWSPPTRRVAQGLLAPLTAGFAISFVILLHISSLESVQPGGPEFARVIGMLWLPLGWVILYGCAINAAAFFMPRGMKLFGWVFIVGGCALFACGIPDMSRATAGHGIMGFFFGALHLAYGVYLYFTEKRKNAA